MIHRAVSIAMLASCLVSPGVAEEVEASEDTEVEAIEDSAVDFDEELDELEIDVEGSIGDAEERRGIGVNGDLRIGYAFAGDDFRDVTIGETDILRARWRLRSTLGFSDKEQTGMVWSRRRT